MATSGIMVEHSELSFDGGTRLCLKGQGGDKPWPKPTTKNCLNSFVRARATRVGLFLFNNNDCFENEIHNN